MFTVAHLGVTGRPRRSLTNTNCIESMISITRTTTGRVKHWRDGTMEKRWIAAGMLEAERSFRRLKGYADMPVVVTDLLADLVARGLRFEHGILAVLDGSKALRKAVVKVFGERALIQRCTLHKRRNVTGYLPADDRDAIDRRLAMAFAQP